MFCITPNNFKLQTIYRVDKWWVYDRKFRKKIIMTNYQYWPTGMYSGSGHYLQLVFFTEFDVYYLIIYAEWLFIFTVYCTCCLTSSQRGLQNYCFSDDERNQTTNKWRPGVLSNSLSCYIWCDRTLFIMILTDLRNTVVWL